MRKVRGSVQARIKEADMCDARNTIEGNCRDARKGTCKYYLWDGRCMKLIKNDAPREKVQEGNDA